MPNTIISRARVVIVDDEASNVRLLERILEMSGCETIFSTTDSRQALKLCLEIEPGHCPARSSHAACRRL